MDITFIFIIVAVILISLGIFKSRGNESSSKTNKADPRAEAEVYIAYGRNKKAIEILENYLVANPDDMTAITLLKKAKG